MSGIDRSCQYLSGSQLGVDVTIHIDGRVCKWVIDTLSAPMCFDLIVSATEAAAHRSKLFDVSFAVESSVERLKSKILEKFRSSVSPEERLIRSSYESSDLTIFSRAKLDSKVQVSINELTAVEVHPDHPGFAEIVFWRAALSREDIEFALRSGEISRALQGRQLAKTLVTEPSEPDWVGMWGL